MTLKYRYKKTLAKKGLSHADRIDAYENAGTLQKINTELVPDAPQLFSEIGVTVIKARVNLELWQNGSKPAKTTFLNCMITLKDGYYKNGMYFESVANDTDNAELNDLLGYELYAKTVKPPKAPLTITNTVFLGVLYFVILAIKRAKFYNIEVTLVTDGVSGTPVLFPSLYKASGNVAGFTSGAKYLIRVQAILTNGNVSEWTPYVAVRVN